MSMGVNKVILVGTVCQDVETSYTGNGSAVTKLNVVTNEKYKSKQTGEMVESAEYHRCVLFGKVAEIAAQYLSKGSKVYLEGKNKTDKWEKDGVTRYSTSVICHQMQFLSSKGEAQQPRDHVSDYGATEEKPKDDFHDDLSSIPF